MPASPMVRLVFGDGTAHEARANQWVMCTGGTGPRFRSMSWVRVGHQVQPDYPDGDFKTVASIEVLPYRRTKTLEEG